MENLITSKIRYSVEHQRNIAYELLDLRRRGMDFSSCFKEQEPVIIYGFDFLGKEICQEIKNRVNVLCFIDRAYDKEVYEGIPVFSLNNEELIKQTDCYDEIKLLVMIISDTEKIISDVTECLKNITYVSLYTLFFECKMKTAAFISEQNSETLEILHKILDDTESDIANIILTGTSYTTLLGMLYLKDWKNSLFIMERFVPEVVVRNMQERGIWCLYERQPVQYYDLCYVISEYARKRHIPVWGHDHMKLSRAFLTNGIRVLEDGLGNYKYSYAKRHMIVLDEGRCYMPMGYDDLVSKVVLTGQFPLPEEIVDKIEVVSPSLLWGNRGAAEKKEIAGIMGFPYEEIEQEIEAGKTIIFMTEPHVSGGEMWMEEEQQIKMYRHILSNYQKSQIMIKPHPGDHINYAEKMPEYYVLKGQFPIQMIAWFGIKIEKYIVMNHSSCLNLLKETSRVDVYDDGCLVEKWEDVHV